MAIAVILSNIIVPVTPAFATTNKDTPIYDVPTDG